MFECLIGWRIFILLANIPYMFQIELHWKPDQTTNLIVTMTKQPLAKLNESFNNATGEAEFSPCISYESISILLFQAEAALETLECLHEGESLLKLHYS